MDAQQAQADLIHIEKDGVVVYYLIIHSITIINTFSHPRSQGSQNFKQIKENNIQCQIIFVQDL